ncbi:MAG: DUF1569 domain-containing protein [Sphingobacteriales bacterium]|nr:DUF1569 domain-containing protein [Sphingobacteriales bacterium]
MKTVFDSVTRDELIGRIRSLDENSRARWGRMNVYQMLKHGRLWEEMMAGRLRCKRVFAGRLFGRLLLKRVLKDDSPLMRKAASSPELLVKETTGDIAAEKAKWIALIQDYAHFSNPGFVHPFFGEMTKEQIGYFAYKHADHHLRQFTS